MGVVFECVCCGKESDQVGEMHEGKKVCVHCTNEKNRMIVAHAMLLDNAEVIRPLSSFNIQAQGVLQ